MAVLIGLHRPGRKAKPLPVPSIAIGRGWVEGGGEPTFQILWTAYRDGTDTVYGRLELTREEATRVVASLAEFINKPT